MSEQLTDGERTILRGIIKLGNRVPASEVAEFVKQKEERVVSILNSLDGRGIIKLETHEITSFTLTDEGREYAIEGLPESRLVKAVTASSSGGDFDDRASWLAAASILAPPEA